MRKFAPRGTVPGSPPSERHESTNSPATDNSAHCIPAGHGEWVQVDDGLGASRAKFRRGYDLVRWQSGSDGRQGNDGAGRQHELAEFAAGAGGCRVRDRAGQREGDHCCEGKGDSAGAFLDVLATAHGLRLGSADGSGHASDQRTTDSNEHVLRQPCAWVWVRAQGVRVRRHVGGDVGDLDVTHKLRGGDGVYGVEGVVFGDGGRGGGERLSPRKLLARMSQPPNSSIRRSTIAVYWPR
ncbi:hypothetical protein ABH935_009866 [Catenulispora sp. GAS73]